MLWNIMGSNNGLTIKPATGEVYLQVCAGGYFSSRETFFYFQVFWGLSMCAETNGVFILEGVFVSVKYWNISG